MFFANRRIQLEVTGFELSYLLTSLKRLSHLPSRQAHLPKKPTLPRTVLSCQSMVVKQTIALLPSLLPRFIRSSLQDLRGPPRDAVATNLAAVTRFRLFLPTFHLVPSNGLTVALWPSGAMPVTPLKTPMEMSTALTLSDTF
jgi:hypothetical protein